MPIGPDEIAAYAVALLTAAVGGGYGVAKLQARTSPSASPDDGDGGETLHAVERLGIKIDALGRKVDQMHLTVGSVVQDLDALKHDVDRLRPQIHDALGRLVALESRGLPNHPKGSP